MKLIPNIQGEKPPDTASGLSQATADLEASELRYRRLFESARDGILILDADTGMVMDVNPFLIELLGFTREAFLGKAIWELGFFKDIVANLENFAKLQQTAYIRYDDKPLETADGRRIDVEFVSNVYLVKDKKVIQCNVRDIAERKRAAEMQRALATLDATEECVFIFDPETLRHSYVNAGAVQHLGYTREELLGMTPLDFKPEFNEARFRELLAPMLRGEVLTHLFTTRYRHKDGRDFPVEINLQYVVPSGERPRFIAIARDITARKREEENLRRMATVVRDSNDSITIQDFEGRITAWNRGAELMYGYSEAEALQMSIERLTASGKIEEQHDFVRRLLAGEVVTSFETQRLTKDGRVLDVWMTVTKLIDDVGNPIGIASTERDITERKQVEAELQKLDKLQSIGVLAGGIAHDFNNILQGLYGNLSLAMEYLAKAHPSYAFLEDAEKSMTRAVRLTKQLLTFAKGGDPVKESVSLGAMAEEIARFDLTGSNVSLDINHDENLWPVDADRGQIQQVVSNLVINARQAMPNGGRLIVTLENADLPAEAVHWLSAGRYVKVTVRDEGDGINPKVVDHIFDPYFTTKQTGSGLGLATVWSIITKHNGHIGVASVLGKGTTFTFYLPASASLQPVKIKPPAAECPPPARPAKILVMDDEEMVCALATKMLTRYGYSVATVPNAQEAFALYKQALAAGAPFDLVIMDLTIPGGPGGKEVIKDLLALDPRVRAIVSSGYAADPVMANPAAYGFKGTAAKPYTARTLREVVARALA